MQKDGLGTAAFGPSNTDYRYILSAPFFFEEALWIEKPSDWRGPIVTGKTYDLTQGEGKRIWSAAMQRTAYKTVGVVGEPTEPLELGRAVRYGAEYPMRPRLGQASFRYRLLDVYGKCAVTHEHSRPALDAAHIIPYSEGGAHEVTNGLLLRADVHRLYDQGYVTVTPDYRFKVSERLEHEFHNGKVYYELQGQRIWLPKEHEEWPSKNNLDYHSSQVFS